MNEEWQHVILKVRCSVPAGQGVADFVKGAIEDKGGHVRLILDDVSREELYSSTDGEFVSGFGEL